MSITQRALVDLLPIAVLRRGGGRGASSSQGGCPSVGGVRGAVIREFWLGLDSRSGWGAKRGCTFGGGREGVV